MYVTAMRIGHFRTAMAIILCSCASAPPANCPATPQVPAPSVASPPLPKKLANGTASVVTPEEALARLFTEPKIENDWFAESFAQAVPASKVEAIVGDIKKELGAYQRVENAGEHFAIVFTKGKVPAKVTLDAHRRIASLWFSPPQLTELRPREEIEADLVALPGKVSYLVLTDGAVIASREPDAPMAVGSAFKLAIVDAIREKIDAKRAQWSDVVRLESRHRSLPSGSLQTWPDKAPITLHSAAALMISVSDNTATDLLLDYVGRTVVEKRAPGNTPFMSTREAFALKAAASASLQARWRAADVSARRAMLPELASVKLGEETKMAETPSVDVEWMFSSRQLCELLAKNKSLDVMRINPGVAHKKDWDLVAYKGGSELGVLNLSSWVEKAGKKHCVVTTWNDSKKDVDSSKLLALHGALLARLR